MSPRIGISPIGWASDDLLQLGEGTPFERILSEARRAGFDGVEYGRRFPQEPAVLMEALRRHELQMVAGWHGSRLLEDPVDAEVRRMERRLDQLVRLDCPRMVVGEITGSVHGHRNIPASKRPLLHPEGLRRFGESLTLVADALEARGVQLNYHPHMGTVVQSGDDVDSLMAATGESVRLCFDIGHLLYARSDPFALMRRHRHRIGHVHLKDVRPGTLQSVESQNSSFLDAVIEGVFTVPGDGAFEFDLWLREFLAEPYDGWLVVEADQDPDRADPLVYATMGRNSLRRWLSAPPQH